MLTYLIVLFITKISKNALFRVPSQVRGHFGEATLRSLRRVVKLKKKVQKSQEDIRFLTTCITYNLTPKMSRFKLHKESAARTPLAQKFRTNLLRTEIKFHHRRIAQLTTQIISLEQTLFSSVTWLFGIRIRAFMKKSIDNYLHSCIENHRKKLKNLGLDISFEKNEAAIFNDTTIRFDEDEIELLSLGLKHSYFPASLDLKNAQAAFEDLFTQVSPHIDNRGQLLKFKNCLLNCYNDYVGNYFHSRRTDYYFSDKIHRTIKNIQTRIDKYNLVIMKADKGNTVVIMYRDIYVEKMRVILNDESKFVRVKEEDTLDRLSRFQNFFYRNFKQILSDKEYKDIYPSAANIPVMYGLPKIHKAGSPLRPILSMVGCFNHAFAQWIGRKLVDLRQAKHVTKDSFSLDFLKESHLNGQYFVSYDVVSLFTNIPLDETINLIIDQLYPKTPGLAAKDQLFCGMTKTIFRNSLNYCLKDNVFIFNSEFFKQVDGCAMGSPLAPILADIFMNHLLERKIERLDHDYLNITFLGYKNFVSFNLKVFVRYVDDTLAVFDSEEEADKFLEYLNGLHSSIKFTCDKEAFEKLPLLDLLLIKDPYSSDDNISITVYRKPTHSGVFTNYTSFIPFQFKVGLIRTLFDRAYKICSTWNLFHLEMENVVRMLSLNGYSKNFTYSVIEKELNKRLCNDTKLVTEGPERKKVYLKLPYIGDMSMKVKGSIRKELSGKFELIFSNSYSKLTQKFGFKDRQPKHLKHDLVYEITCSCGRRYIGETCRALKTRFDEHMKTSGSGMTEVGKHLSSSPTCKITFEQCRVLTFESNMYRRKIKESLFIQQYDDGSLINDKLASVPLFLFSLPTHQDQLRGRIFPSFR